MKHRCAVLLSISLFSVLAAPVLGISIGYNAVGSGSSVSSHTRYSLDDSASLTEQAELVDGTIFQSRQASGKGYNSIDQTVSTEGQSASNKIDSVGAFCASASAQASADGLGVHQSLRGSGDLEATIGGKTVSGSSSQVASVNKGDLSTILSLIASDGIVSRQDTNLKGQSGGIASSSSSQENEMAVAGGFSGEGDLSADLSAMAANRASMSGDASLVGVPLLDSENLQVAASGDIAMSVDGLFVQPKGELGSFGLSATNFDKAPGGGVPLYDLPNYDTYSGGRNDAYVLAGWRWNQNNPQIKLYLRDDTNLRNEKLTATAVKSALENAANTWDAATNQNLFIDNNAASKIETVTISSTARADAYDGKNVVAWKGFPSNMNSALAYSRSWYNSKMVGGYYSALESDLSFNTRYSWSTIGVDGTPNYSGRPIDVETVVLHELGHTIGLGDLYGKSQFAGDTRQIMHYYDRIKRTLGNGDKTGAFLLYG
jgi:hypothetical protein